MFDWLKPRDRRQDHRRRFEVERDRRIQAELDEGVKHRERRTSELISELHRLERVLARDGR